MHIKKLLTNDKEFYSSLLKLSLPMTLQYLVSFLIALTNSVSIGRIGKEATAEAYIGTLVFTVLQMLLTGIESGITVLASRYWGENDKYTVERITSFGVAVSLLLGIAAALVSILFPSVFISLFIKDSSSSGGAEYLRLLAFSFPFFCLSGAFGSMMKSIESPKITAFASLGAFLINLVFNVALVGGKFGFSSLGITGSAIATIIARISELIIILIYVFLIDKKIKLKPRDLFKYDKSKSFNFIKYTLPIVLGQIVWIINTLFSSYLLSKKDSVDVVAGLAVASTLNSLSYIMMNGLSGAVGIIIGKTIGEGKIEKIRSYSYTTQIIFIFLGILTSLTLIFIRTPFISLYNVGEAAASVANELILVLSVTIIGTSYQSACLIGLVKSGGDVSFILKNDAFFIFLVIIPLSVITFKSGAPVWLIFLALKSDQILKCIPAAIKINRFKWIKRLSGESKK